MAVTRVTKNVLTISTSGISIAAVQAALVELVAQSGSSSSQEVIISYNLVSNSYEFEVKITSDTQQ
jgi:hypothetical protein